MCVSLARKIFFFSNEDKITTQNNYEEKTGRVTKFGGSIHPNNGIIPLSSDY